MKNKYIDLIQQAFEVPNEEFTMEDGELQWFGIPLMEVIKQYGTPLRICYLPKIGANIQRLAVCSTWLWLRWIIMVHTTIATALSRRISRS